MTATEIKDTHNSIEKYKETMCIKTSIALPTKQQLREYTSFPKEIRIINTNIDLFNHVSAEVRIDHGINLCKKFVCLYING